MRTIAGVHSKKDKILLVKIAKYIGFCVYRRSYLIWPPVVLLNSNAYVSNPCNLRDSTVVNILVSCFECKYPWDPRGLKSFQPVVPLTLTRTLSLSFLYFDVVLDSVLQNYWYSRVNDWIPMTGHCCGTLPTFFFRSMYVVLLSLLAGKFSLLPKLHLWPLQYGVVVVYHCCFFSLLLPQKHMLLIFLVDVFFANVSFLLFGRFSMHSPTDPWSFHTSVQPCTKW